MVHGIQAILDVHLDWVVLQVDVVNTFYYILRKAISWEVRATKGQLFLLFHFVPSFYA
jgi:hypothetical protein